MAKKIGAIVSLVLVALVVVATIVMANIDVNHNIDYRKPDHVWVSYNGTSQKMQNSDEIDKVINLIDNATSENFLTALFGGSLKEKPELVHYKSTSTNIPSTSGYYVMFKYDNLQKINEGNGIRYTQLVFTINDTDGEEVETKVYISEDGTMTYKKYYELEVDYSNVYKYLTEQGYQN